jgi:hypothetical protein
MTVFEGGGSSTLLRPVFVMKSTFLLLLLLSSPALAAPPTATEKHLQLQVIGVHDGDTLTGLTAEKEHVEVCPDAIDAPELKSLEDSEDLPPPVELAQEIADDLQTAWEQFAAIAENAKG